MHPAFKAIKYWVALFYLVLGIGFQPSANSQMINFKHLTLENGLPDLEIHSIYQGAHGYIWALTAKGTVRFDGFNAKLFSKEKGFRVWNPPRVELADFSTSCWINDTLHDREGYFWVSTECGLFQRNFRDEPGVFRKIQLPSTRISSVFQDREGSYWVSSLDQGVFFLPSAEFKSIFLTDDFSPADIHFLHGYGDMVLAAGNGDRLFLLKGDQLVKTFPFKYESQVRIQPDPTTNSFLIAAEQYPIMRLNWKDFNLRTCYQGFNKSLSALASGRQGELWGIGSQLYQLRNFPIDRGLDQQKTFQALLEDKAGQIWAGSRFGLHQFSEEEFHFWGDSDPLLAGPISSLAEVDGGILLIANQLHGLVEFDHGQATLIPLAQPGQARIRINHLISDGQFVWLATNQGVFRGIKQDQEWVFRNFSEQDGLLSNQVRQVYVKGSEIWAATDKGLTFFDYLRLSESPQPNLLLQEIRVNGSSMSLPPDNSIFLQYWENNVQFDFRDISYRESKGKNYRYKLVGLEGDYHITSTPSVDYDRLPFGGYKFDVAVQDRHGNWSPFKTLVEFNISSPWWEQVWFILLVIVLFALAVGVLVVLRVRVVRKNEQIRTRMVELEKRALQAQMNPHFLFNSLNAIQGFLSENDTQKAEEYLADYARLIRLILENSRGSMVFLSRELELIEKYISFESMRFSDRIRFTMEIDSGIDQDQLMVPPMLLQPFIENAVVHGLANKKGEGRVIIRVKMLENHLFCTIEDNGVGREQTAESASSETGSSSAGLTITRERLQLLNQQLSSHTILNLVDLYDDASRPIGTRVEVYIPYQARKLT